MGRLGKTPLLKRRGRASAHLRRFASALRVVLSRVAALSRFRSMWHWDSFLRREKEEDSLKWKVGQQIDNVLLSQFGCNGIEGPLSEGGIFPR